MTWTPPQSENEWLECLSAWQDGEMAPDERRSLEEFLESNPLRKAQLQALIAVSNSLQDWKVEDPEPSPAFVRRLKKAFPGKNRLGDSIRRSSGLSVPSWAFQFAFFLLGALVGAFAMSLLPLDWKSTSHILSSNVSSQPGVVNIFYRSDQAEDLLREVAAGNLKDDLLRNVQNKQWKKAISLYNTLLEKYADTTAARQVVENKDVSPLKELLRSEERI